MTASRIWYVGGEDLHLRIPLLRRLVEKGFAVSAVGSAGRSAFSGSGIDYYEYSLDRWINPLADWRAVGQLARLFGDGRPDLVHAFDTKPGILAAMAARRVNGMQLVRTITGMGYLFSSRSPLAAALRPLYRTLQRNAAQDAAMTVFQNADDQRYFVANGMVAPERSTLVPGSGIDVQEFLSAVPGPAQTSELRQTLGVTDKIVVTMVARLVRHKGILEFLHCARRLRSRSNAMAFLLVGPRDSEGSQAIGSQVLERFREDVVYLGARRDVPAILAASDVFVLPSYYREGVPRVLLEAGAVGLPLVTTDMPGCRDVVRHGWNGLLVRPRSVEALCEAVEAVASDLAAWRQRGERNRAYVEQNFSTEMVAASYASIYHSILAAGAGER